MTPLETVLAQLERLGCRPRKSGCGWLALCPYHELDGGKHRPSLAVAQTQDGKALLRCFANCPTELVLERLDLRWQDLWPDSVRPKVLGNGQSITKPADGNGQAGKSYPTVEAALTDLQRSLGRPTGLWPYHNTAGELVGLVCRFGLPGGEKSYRPLTPCQDGWRIAAMKEPRPLYRLSDLLAADPRTPIVVCEGEKAAEAARLCGLQAITSSGGAQAAAKTDWTPLAGRKVIILPDNDESGLQYAQGVARLALEAGAASVKIVRLSDYCPLLPEHGDIADVLADPAWCGACLGESATPEDFGRLVLQWANEAPEVPQPQSEETPIPNWQPFPLEALPEPFRSFTAEAAEALQVDPASVALSLLTVAASAIGGSRRLAPKDGWNVPSVLWTAILQPSGSLKSPVRRSIFRWTQKRQEALFQQYRLDRQQYEVELGEYEKQWKEWLRDQKKSLPPAKPIPPAQQRVWVQDITIEKVAALLADNPRGFLLATDELGAWFGSFDRYARTRGGDVNHWLPLYNGEPVLVDRKAGETIYTPHGYVSILGYIVPETFQRICQGPYLDNGLVARFCLVYPPPRLKQWTETAISPVLCQPVGEVFQRLYDLEMDVGEDGQPTYRLMRLHAKAKQEYVHFYNKHNLELVGLSGSVEAAFKKLEELPLRLAMVIHLIRWASGQPVDPDSVDEASMAAAITITQWQKQETIRIYRLLFAQAPSDGMGELVQWIAQRGGAVTARDLTHYCSRYKGRTEEAEADLNELACRGFGRWETKPSDQKGGRPTRIFRLISESPNLQNPLKSEKKEVSEIWRYGDERKNRSKGQESQILCPPEEVPFSEDEIFVLENEDDGNGGK